jgi:hypothetical protein
MEEVRDRYGPHPITVLNLADYGRIRVLADALGIESIEREGALVAIRFREKAKVDPLRVIHLVRERGDLQLVPPVSLKLDLKKPLQPPVAVDPRLKSAHGKAQERGGFRRRPRPEPAWWTARATAAEVTPGFSKAEILKPKEDDPRAPGGILERLAHLLEDLRE